MLAFPWGKFSNVCELVQPWGMVCISYSSKIGWELPG